jgi:hypothetical protein
MRTAIVQQHSVLLLPHGTERKKFPCLRAWQAMMAFSSRISLFVEFQKFHSRYLVTLPARLMNVTTMLQSRLR